MYFTVMKCSDSPCRHGACKDTAKGFSCDCPTHYSGQTCDLCMLEPILCTVYLYWSTESLRSLINTCILSDYGYRRLLKYNKANFSDTTLLDNFLFNRKHVVVDFQ